MNGKVTCIAALLCSLTIASSKAAGPPAFEERVAAQEAIERVYYEHRIWPEDNPAPKPSFEQMVPRAAIEAKVTDTIRKSNALDVFWKRPITAAQLRAEMDRMARDTRDPDLLLDLFGALGNDPALVAECLARPVLADRLIRNWYAHDTRCHAEARRGAEAAHDRADPLNLEAWPEGEYRRCAYRLADRDVRRLPPAGTPGGAVPLARRDFDTLLARHPVGEGLIVREEREAFVLSRPASVTAKEIVLERLLFPKRDFDSWWREVSVALPRELPACREPDFDDFSVAIGSMESGCSDAWLGGAAVSPDLPDTREYFSFVWTGTEMIVWGGLADDIVNTGGAYNPATDTWRATSTGPFCPAARYGHAVVWTGAEMIVWGGRGRADLQSGGRYDPVSDTWQSVSSATACPSGRSNAAAVWTGTEMIVWGGRRLDPYPDVYEITGGRYDPITDTWRATAGGADCPSGRSSPTAVWTGTEMIVWGGYRDYDYFDTGGQYDPVSDTWRNLLSGPGHPSRRGGHSAVWTGTEMIIWGGYSRDSGKGGYLDSGARFNPVTGGWRATAAGGECPSAREYHTAVWTGAEMIIWGGYDQRNLSTGGRYDPATDSWSPTSTGVNCPSERRLHAAVWTGTEMIVWGHETQTGGRYDPDSDTWVPTSTDAVCPSARRGHTAVWTGAEMIVWGGEDWIWGSLATGGLYDRALDVWRPTPAGGGCPSERGDHSAVWTGTEMVVWGGLHWGASSTEYLRDGGRFDPLTDTWSPTSTGDGCPAGRASHTAVWTGKEMIVWGGDGNTGGRYDPETDAWVPTADAGAPGIDGGHTAVWTGTEMIVWGGLEGYVVTSEGGRYDPAADTWFPTASGPGCPDARVSHTAVWTGAEMIIWGGAPESGWTDRYFASGGRYDPADDSWRDMPAYWGGLPGRTGHTSVWTGSEMVVWGGLNENEYPDYMLDGGGRYDPVTDSWMPTVKGSYCPAGRNLHTAVWAGKDMIVWGGGEYQPTASGGIYRIMPESLALIAAPSPNEGAVPLPVSFDVGAETQGCAEVPDFLWDFGDGETSTQEDPVHEYVSVGEFEWSVIATVNGVSAVESGTVVVTEPPCGGITCSAAAAPDTGTAPLMVTFAASAQPDPCGGPVVFGWEFGDGTSGEGEVVSHEYAAPGAYVWTMTAAAQDHSCTKGGTVVVNCIPPTVTKVKKLSEPFRLKIETAIPLIEGWEVFLAHQDSPWRHVKQKGANVFVIKKAKELFPKDGSETVIEIVNGDGCATAIAYNRKTKSWRPFP